MLVACYAYEGMYGGLHGIHALAVMQVSDKLEDAIEEVEEWGRESSEDLIYSFGLEDDYLSEYDEDDEEADITESNYYYDRGWVAHRIKNEYAQKYSEHELDVKLSNEGFNLFVERYCDKEALF